MASSANSENMWEQVVRDFRQACLLKRAGKASESALILDDILPKAIAAWSRECPRNGLRKRAELVEMFRAEERKIDEFVQAQQFAAQVAVENLVASLRNDLQRQLMESLLASVVSAKNGARHAEDILLHRNSQAASDNARIKFDDIPAVIDTVPARQRADYHAQPAKAA
ncbi:MAG: hypothetical protein HY043_02460 [Verrucomicrobia bacterium]|nr:hypothetical protein [Verrucomicrobiota bacterium]